MRSILLLALAFAQLPYARQALDLGRTRDDALLAAFNNGYALGSSDPIDHAEVITEFRRAVLIVRQHALQGEYGFTAVDLDRAMKPYAGQVTFVVDVRLHPLNTFVKEPPYEIYVSTGPATGPIPVKNFVRSPIYSPGGGFGGRLAGVHLEGTFDRAMIDAAPDPTLVVIDEQANVLWRTPLVLARYR